MCNETHPNNLDLYSPVYRGSLYLHVDVIRSDKPVITAPYCIRMARTREFIQHSGWWHDLQVLVLEDGTRFLAHLPSAVRPLAPWGCHMWFSSRLMAGWFLAYSVNWYPGVSSSSRTLVGIAECEGKGSATRRQLTYSNSEVSLRCKFWLSTLAVCRNLRQVSWSSSCT